MRHKHADVIHAWADGAQIQYLSPIGNRWKDCEHNEPRWNMARSYRVKPTPITDEQTDNHSGICLEVEA